MKNSTKGEKLEDILDSYVVSSDGPTRSLDDWVQRYPEYEHEITEFAASWSLLEALPPAPDAEEVDEDTLVLWGMSVVQNVLHERQLESKAVSDVLPDSLLAEGQARGLKPREFAQLAELGDSLLRKLDRRLISPASIPREVIEVLARLTQLEPDAVGRYLRKPPTFAHAAEHRAEQAPEIREAENFFEAVRADPTIEEGHAARWLTLEPRTNNRGGERLAAP